MIGGGSSGLIPAHALKEGADDRDSLLTQPRFIFVVVWGGEE
jgi:hypothetical protein